MSCALCGRTIRPGTPHYMAADMIVCSRCPFHRGEELHDLAAPTPSRSRPQTERPVTVVYLILDTLAAGLLIGWGISHTINHFKK